MSFEQPNQSRPDKNKKSRIGDHRLSRREFLKLAGIAAATAAGLGVFLYPEAKRKVEDTFYEKEIDQEIKKLKEDLEKKYKINIEFDFNKTEEGILSWEALSPSEKRDALKCLMENIALYPPEFLAQTAIKQIVLVKNLTSQRKENKISGVAITNGIIFMNYKSGILGWGDEEATKGAIHHELLHEADAHDKDRAKIKKQWANLNPGGENDYFKTKADLDRRYKELGKEKFDELVDKHTGFINVYSMISEEEDRATVAQSLLSYPKDIMELAKDDPILIKKIEAIKKQYKKWTNGRMNEKFWQDLAEEKVDNN